MRTALEVYEQVIRALPRSEQLRIAALILDDITCRGDLSELDWDWSTEDQHEAAAHALEYAEQCLGSADGLV